MLAVAFLFLDIFASALLHEWILQSTMVYFLASITLGDYVVRPIHAVEMVLCVLILDFVMHGRVGMVLLFIVPAYFLVRRLKTLLRFSTFLLLMLLITAFILYENVGYMCFFEHYEPSIFVTNVKILSNVIIGYMVLWGMQGNRSLTTQVGRGRKVWTPNRKDASQEL